MTGERLGARVLSGPDVLERLGPALDELHRDAGVPITGRRPWLGLWVDCYARYEPVAVVVGPPGDRIEAAALLATRRRAGLTNVVALGHGPSDYVRLPATSDEAAAALADAVAAWLGSLRGPWRLRLEQLPVGDPVARALRDRLPAAVLVPGDGAPRMVFGDDRDPKTLLSRNARQSERTAWNRITREGLPVSMALLRTPEEVDRFLLEMEEVRRSRDAQLARRTGLDNPSHGRFWREAIREIARRGEAEVIVLHLDQRMAAYVVCFLDGSASRMWDGRFDPEWAWFGAGRITDLTAFHRARLDPACNEYDWMRGEEEYKLRHGNDVVPAEHLLAWSSAAVRAVTESPRRLRGSLRRVKERSPRLRRAWEAVKRRTIARRRSS